MGSLRRRMEVRSPRTNLRMIDRDIRAKATIGYSFIEEIHRQNLSVNHDSLGGLSAMKDLDLLISFYISLRSSILLRTRCKCHSFCNRHHAIEHYEHTAQAHQF